MFRILVIAALASACGPAEAQGLPDIDIKAHCERVDGGAERVARCIGNEKAALQWFKTRNINQRILYQCSHELGLATVGYVLLRACVSWQAAGARNACELCRRPLDERARRCFCR